MGVSGEREFTRDMLVDELRHIWKGEADEHSEDFLDGLAVLASLVCGANEERIAEFTGVDRARVDELGERLRLSGIWVGSRVDSEAWFRDGGGLDFTLAVQVALGDLVRDGDRFSLTEQGTEKAKAILRKMTDGGASAGGTQ